MNTLVIRNEIQEKINNNESILGMEVVGVDGCQSPYKGIIRELSVYDHRILGVLVQVWVEWFYEGYPKGHLEGYDQNQFKKWEGNTSKVGVYYE